MVIPSLLLLLTRQATDPVLIMRWVDDTFRDVKSGYYIESNRERFPAYNWGIGVLISAQNRIAKLEPSYRRVFESTLVKNQAYWNPQGPVPGYDVQPGKTGDQDRYYDDNAWMVMALVESYEITGDAKWLKRAQQSLDYVLSGEDDRLGGGIYWKEQEKTSKNTCSNAPAAAACLAVFKHIHDHKLLEKALTLYDWTKRNLQAPDGLYWDNVQLNGKIGKTKWSYNSALMLRTAKELAAITHDIKYQMDASRLEVACIKRWIKSDGTIDDELQFAHLLFENLDPQKFDAKKCIDKMLSGRDAEGFFGTHWGKPSTGKHQLIHQVSAVRALAVYELRQKR